MPPVLRAQLDYYAVLEITPTADLAEVNAAFRRLAWRYHPDRNPAPGATIQFQDINEAHQVLTDPVRRAEYDAQWHPRTPENPVPRSRAAQVHHRRRWHRHHRHLRTVLVTAFALLFVSTAWTVIFAAMTAAHSSGGGFFAESSTSSVAEAPVDCSFSMEMFPVSYLDARGRVKTGWETVVHNCWGGSTRLSSLPVAGQASIGRIASFAVQ
jgi:molecular chaperone DnaJ